MSESSPVKTGADHLAALRDGRAVYIDGERVDDVTTHPAFRNAVHQAAALYDYQAQPENIERLTFAPSPGTGYRRIHRCWLLPRSHAELVARREAMVEWAEQSAGFLGRAPDHVASSLVGQVIGIDVFRRHGAARAQALLDYFDEMSRNDSYVSYVIINPQGERNKAWGEQQDDLVARIVDEDSAGITIRGAKMLGTGTIMANELLVANLQPLRAGEGGPRGVIRDPSRDQGVEGYCLANPMRRTPCRRATIRFPRGLTKTTRSPGSRMSRCRGSASLCIATQICAGRNFTTRSGTHSRTTNRRSG